MATPAGPCLAAPCWLTAADCNTGAEACKSSDRSGRGLAIGSLLPCHILQSSALQVSSRKAHSEGSNAEEPPQIHGKE